MRRTLLLLIALLLTPSVFAAHYANFYVIPVAGHTAGLNGTNWVSDVAIQNFQAVPLEVRFAFIQSGTDTTDNVGSINLPTPGSGNAVTVPAGGNVMLRDVVRDFRGMTSVLGALLVGADLPFAITSRVWNTSTNVGHTVPAVRDFLDNSLGTTANAGATAYVPGLVQNASYRTNLGFVAATTNASSGMTISINTKAADGSSLGVQTYAVLGGSVVHLQIPLRDITTGNAEVAGAEFRITSGNGTVVPYAAVVHNTSADAVFMLGQFPANTPSGKTGFLSPFEELFARFIIK